MVLDPRCPWVTVERTSQVPAWRLTGFRYQDENQSGGNHHIFYTVLDERGTPVSGVTAWLKWLDAAPDEAKTPILGGTGNIPLFGGPFYPDRGQVGAYRCYIESPDESDVVWGMGLPVNRHVNYLVTFQLVVELPSEPVTETNVLGRMARALRLAADDLEKPE